MMNTLYLALLLGAIWLGTSTHRRVYVNIGFAFFGIFVFSKYLEFFWDRLSGGVFFIATGCVLLAIAVGLERTRRRFLEVRA
jgi:uncharacterized membrane protein